MHQNYEMKQQNSRLVNADDELRYENFNVDEAINSDQSSDHNVLNELKNSFSMVRDQMKTPVQYLAALKTNPAAPRARKDVTTPNQSGCSGDFESDELKEETDRQCRKETVKDEPQIKLSQMIRNTKQYTELHRMYDAVKKENQKLEVQCDELRKAVTHLQERLVESFDNINALHVKALAKQTRQEAQDKEDNSDLELRFDKLLAQNRMLLAKVNQNRPDGTASKTESLQAKIAKLEESQAALRENHNKLRLEAAKLRHSLAQKDQFIAKIKKLQQDKAPKLKPESTKSSRDLEEMLGSVCIDAGKLLAKGKAEVRFGRSLGSNEKQFLELFITSLRRVLRRDSVLERMELAEMVPPIKFDRRA